MNYGQRLKTARKRKGYSQNELAEITGVGQGSISKIERGDQESSTFDITLAEALDVHPKWLQSGEEKHRPAWLNPTTQLVISNAQYQGELEAWDSTSELNPDDIELPYFREVELSAGKGRHQVIENHGEKLRFPRSTLKKQGVQIECAYCVKISGNSMEPVLPDGCTVGIDTSKRKIIDGDWYAIDHAGHLRVKAVYKMPNNKIRLRSFNSQEYPDETIEAEEAKILGRVFWWSGLR